MNASELKQICIEGSTRLYEHVSKRRNGGAQEIAVADIEIVDTHEFKLKLSRTIFDLDSIRFVYTDIERRYLESDELSIAVYDHEQRFVIVKTSSEVADLLKESIEHPDNWILTFDLKFLIKRVIEWYEAHGDGLRFLNGRKSSALNFDTSLVFSDAQPSEEQARAIDACFNQPLSYIWGAPGTGKTRFVLSYALLNYLNNDSKVLVLAPTNLALEQIFRGIVGVLQRAKIDRRKLLRLGTPTKAFAKDYGEICEDKGLDVKLAQLNRQIEILESIQMIDQRDGPTLLEMIRELQWLDKRQKLVRISDAKLAKLQAEIDSASDTQSALSNSIKAHMKALDASITNPVKHATIEESQAKLIAKLQQSKHKLDDNLTRYKSIDGDVSSLRKIVNKRLNKVQSLARKCGLEDTELSLSNIQSLEQEALSSRARLFSMAQEYEQFAESEMADKLKHYKSDAITLKSYTSEARLYSAGVVGMTLDSYIARSKDKPIDADHIFIDEAGYASAIKTLTAFASDVPITFLGDHKQLPPVCEMARDEILKADADNAVLMWDLSAIFCESIWCSNSFASVVENYKDQRSPVFNELKRRALTKSYRFGKKLASVLHQHVYIEEGFCSGLEHDTQISVFNVDNRAFVGEGDFGRRANTAEANCVIKILDSGILENDDFAILTPYRDQVSLLAKLKPELAEQGRLLTVHKSQGREWHTVIYNVCDIGNGAHPWFTDSRNDLSSGLSNVNTAVSRAKKHLIIVCDSKAWQAKDSQLISGLIDARTRRYQYQA